MIIIKIMNRNKIFKYLNKQKNGTKTYWLYNILEPFKVESKM